MTATKPGFGKPTRTKKNTPVCHCVRIHFTVAAEASQREKKKQPINEESSEPEKTVTGSVLSASVNSPTPMEKITFLTFSA